MAGQANGANGMEGGGLWQHGGSVKDQRDPDTLELAPFQQAVIRRVSQQDEVLILAQAGGEP